MQFSDELISVLIVLPNLKKKQKKNKLKDDAYFKESCKI